MLLETLRAIFGLVYVMFIPGFAATWALFPKREKISDIERLALSFGLSIALTTLPVIALNYAGLKITPINTFITILLVTLTFTTVAIYRMKN